MEVERLEIEDVDGTCTALRNCPETRQWNGVLCGLQEGNELRHSQVFFHVILVVKNTLSYMLRMHLRA